MAYAHFFARIESPYESEAFARNAEAILPETGHGKVRRPTSRETQAFPASANMNVGSKKQA